MKFSLIIYVCSLLSLPHPFFSKYHMATALLGLLCSKHSWGSLPSDRPYILMGSTRYTFVVVCSVICSVEEEGRMRYCDQGRPLYWSQSLRSERRQGPPRGRKWGRFLQTEARVCLVGLRGIKMMAHGAKEHGRNWDHKWHIEHEKRKKRWIYKIVSRCITSGFLNPGEEYGSFWRLLNNGLILFFQSYTHIHTHRGTHVYVFCWWCGHDVWDVGKRNISNDNRSPKARTGTQEVVSPGNTMQKMVQCPVLILLLNF